MHSPPYAPPGSVSPVNTLPIAHMSTVLPPKIREDVAYALMMWRNSTVGERTETIGSLAAQICQYAVGEGMNAESLVIALHGVLEEVGNEFPPHRADIRAIYDRLLARCLKIYFDQRHPPIS